MNYSSFRTEGGKSEPGLSLGFSKKFYPNRSSNGFFGVGLSYLTKKLKLENKTWPSGIEPERSDVQVGDIPVDRSYLEFDTRFGYSFSGHRAKATIELFAGPSFSYPIKYLSRTLSDSTIFLKPDERGKYDFDYLRCESEGAEGASDFLRWSMGFTFVYKSFGVEIRYDRALSRQECIRGLTINDAIDSFHVVSFFRF